MGGPLPQDVVDGAAAYEATENKDNSGQPPSHEDAKNMIAAIRGNFIDRSAETSSKDQQSGDKASLPQEVAAGASLPQDVTAGAAAFEATEIKDKTDQPPSHEEAKKMISDVSGGFVDRGIETKGPDYVDREKLKGGMLQQLGEGIKKIEPNW